MTPNSLYVVLLAGAVFVFMAYRQFASRRVEDSRRALLIALALVVWGVVSLSRAPLGGVIGLTMLAGGAVAGLVLGVGRGTAMRTWVTDDGEAWQRGGVLLALLWVVSIGVRMGLGYAGARAGVPQATSFAEVPVFFGVTLAAQNAYVLAKARRGLGSAAQHPAA